MKNKIRMTVKMAALLCVAILGMGNKGCKEQVAVPDQKDPERQLRRRIQLTQLGGSVAQIPDFIDDKSRVIQKGAPFDFPFVASAQMEEVLNSTQTFSTAASSSDEILSGSSPDRNDSSSVREFYDCRPVEDRENSGVNFLQKSSGWTEEAACMVDMPAGVLQGSVLSFEFNDRKGGSIGISAGNVSLGLGGVYEQFSLGADLKVLAPMQRGSHAQFATVQTTKYKRNVKSVGLGLVFGPLTIGPQGYFASTNNTLRELVRDVFSEAVKNLYNQWAALEPWYGMILKDCDNRGIYINAGRGSDAGLKVGDVLKIVNVQYTFEGPVCQSYLNGDLAKVDDPIAYARVTAVGYNLSQATIIEDDDVRYPIKRTCTAAGCTGRPRIKPGARAYLHQLVEQVKK